VLISLEPIGSPRKAGRYHCEGALVNHARAEMSERIAYAREPRKLPVVLIVWTARLNDLESNIQEFVERPKNKPTKWPSTLLIGRKIVYADRRQHSSRALERYRA
jgi:hypothetical protein